MRDTLFPFQETAKDDLHRKIQNAHASLTDRDLQAITFSAPTGAGKTLVMTTLFEEIFYGSAMNDAQLDAVIVWLSDMPELNEQTRLKIESKSDKIPVRDLITIDSNYDMEYLEGGRIYFLNTQKLGSDRLLTQKSDDRDYTIWETLSNTAARNLKGLYIVIDEAHRGTYSSARAEEAAQSIMQRFIFGSPADGLRPMPLIIGVTATPQRFERLLGDTDRTRQRVKVSPEDVRDSGLLKDRIILHYPENPLHADMAMFRGAVENWRQKCFQWDAYCKREGEKEVRPILVVQVEDGSDTTATRTDIGECLISLEEVLNRKLRVGEVVHTFNDRGTLCVNGVDIQYIEASRIEESEGVLLVFFKMNLTTGWDCPRAETMMSFRSAQDYTYIAQLLGRMIRTPLARRIISNAELNNVSLYLPHFNEETVKGVVEALRDSEIAMPAETGTSKELVSLERNLDYSDIFAAMGELVTYHIDSARKQSSLRLFLQLSRALTMDGIDFAAWRNAKQSVLLKMEEELLTIKQIGDFKQRVSTITGFTVGTLTFDYGDNAYSIDDSAQLMTVSDFDISRHFEQAGRLLGESLHIEYWLKHSDRDHLEVKVEVIVLSSDIDAMERLNAYASEQLIVLYENNKRLIARLNEARKNIYAKIINSSEKPIAIPWILPDSIDCSVVDGSMVFKKHLYCFPDGTFKTNLNSWEKDVIQAEIDNGLVAWLRNFDRKKWSLEIPYDVNGISTPMFPDLVVVRADEHGYVFDILEPHDPSRKDNYPKAVGLAKFAQEHWASFGRIQLIRLQRGDDGHNHIFRLDMSKVDIRNIVRGITSNEELDRVFELYATR